MQLPPSEAYRRMQMLEKQMTPEEFRNFRQIAMRPYRTRNIALSLTLFGGMAAIFAFSMYKMRPDDFNKLEELEKYAKKPQQ
eukprot:jgi/Hompol1/3844/HPOL_006780-RA